MDRNKICRLCAKTCRNQKLTSLDDPFRCIRSKLFRCSQIDITDDNKSLPQNVCSQCVINLEQCWNFTEAVSAAQTKLQLQFSDDPLCGVKVEEVIIGEDQFPLTADYEHDDDGDGDDDDDDDESEGQSKAEAEDKLPEMVGNVPAVAGGEAMEGNTQMAILNRMSKLEAKFEIFMKRFEAASSSSEFITGAEEYKSFEPIDSIEKLDEFEENLKDAEFENRTFQSLKNICGPKANIGGLNTCYVLVDVIFSRRLMTLVSWAGGSKTEDVQKAPFKIYTRTIHFFLKLVRVSEPSVAEVVIYDFFKNKAISNSKRRLIEPKRASRTKNRKRIRLD